MEASRDELLQAMDLFDQTCRDADEWAGWEQNRTYKYAIEKEERRYPVKKIVSLATGIPVNDFSGGVDPGHANEVVERTGLKVISLERPTSFSYSDDTPFRTANTVGDIAAIDSRFFIKSEWGPVSAFWPALSFSKRSVGDLLRREYNSARDFIVYAGTSSAQRTKAEEHRRSIISILVTEPGEPVPTEKLVPWDSWQAVLAEHGMVWPYSFGVVRGWLCVDFPKADELTPEAYRALGFRSNWGSVVEVLGAERESLFQLRIKWVDLPNREVMREVAGKRSLVRTLQENRPLNLAVTRMAQLIQERIGFGRISKRTLPMRTLSPHVNLVELLCSKIQDQGNLCALCRRPLNLVASNRMLQCSPDRIDSSSPSYGPENLQITHLACNLAKNDGTAEEFEEWIQLICGD